MCYLYAGDGFDKLLCRAVPCCAVPCCAVLCRAVPCCAVLCWAVLCCAGLCCAVLCCAGLCWAVLCCAVLCWARCVVKCAFAFCAVSGYSSSVGTEYRCRGRGEPAGSHRELGLRAVNAPSEAERDRGIKCVHLDYRHNCTGTGVLCQSRARERGRDIER